jgi:hypothetical protein
MVRPKDSFYTGLRELFKRKQAFKLSIHGKTFRAFLDSSVRLKNYFISGAQKGLSIDRESQYEFRYLKVAGDELIVQKAPKHAELELIRRAIDKSLNTFSDHEKAQGVDLVTVLRKASGFDGTIEKFRKLFLELPDLFGILFADWFAVVKTDAGAVKIQLKSGRAATVPSTPSVGSLAGNVTKRITPQLPWFDVLLADDNTEETAFASPALMSATSNVEPQASTLLASLPLPVESCAPQWIHTLSNLQQVVENIIKNEKQVAVDTEGDLTEDGSIDLIQVATRANIYLLDVPALFKV